MMAFFIAAQKGTDVGSIIITIPDIPDANLIYTESETRQILKFFWPDSAAAIDELAINDRARALAQTALIAAIDGSYAMGYVHGLFRAITHRNRDVAALARRLARNFMQHWWRHTQQRDLEDVQIYESVRARVADSLRERLEELRNGIALRRGSTTVALV